MKNKTWGGRFEKQLDKRVVKFNASLPFDYILYKYDIRGSKAHANMLGNQGLITQQEAKKICRVLDVIATEISKGLHPFDNTCEDIHMFIEQLLIEKIGTVGKKLHTGRSRNDQVALDLRLYVKDACDQVGLLLDNVKTTLSILMNKHEHDMMPGYTHLQQAQPISLGAYFGAYVAMFERDVSRLQDCYKRLNVSPLGAAALAGSSLPLQRHAVAKELGFDGIIENTIDAVSDRDFVIEFCSVASMIMIHASRLCEDLILWATQEFNFITLDDAFATGSSLMPNKKNPDVLELIRGKSGRVFGHLMGILAVMKGLPLAYNKDMQEDKEGLFDTVTTLVACLEIIPPFLNAMRCNVDEMNKKATSGYLDATKIVESLVLNGIPFRDAHHHVGLWVAKAIEKGVSLNAIIESKNPFDFYCKKRHNKAYKLNSDSFVK